MRLPANECARFPIRDSHTDATRRPVAVQIFDATSHCGDMAPTHTSAGSLPLGAAQVPRHSTKQL